jgi:hypothetical protein
MKTEGEEKWTEVVVQKSEVVEAAERKPRREMD